MHVFKRFAEMTISCFFMLLNSIYNHGLLSNGLFPNHGLLG